MHPVGRGAELFESRVVLDGSQTPIWALAQHHGFESRVVLDGSQTKDHVLYWYREFESRVVLDGSQTIRTLSPG